MHKIASYNRTGILVLLIVSAAALTGCHPPSSRDASLADPTPAEITLRSRLPAAKNDSVADSENATIRPVPSLAKGSHDNSIRKRARRDLDSQLRRYERKRESFQRSEFSYYERLHQWQWTFLWLQLQGTPGTFAGEMPGHDEYLYTDFIESADLASDLISDYIERYIVSDDYEPDVDFRELLEREQVLLDERAIKFPGSGSRLADAIAAMKTPEYKKIAKENAPKMEQFMFGSVLRFKEDASNVFDNTETGNYLKGKWEILRKTWR